ncbi:MAG TPA: hypothetical protein VNX68_04310 [Nitrosopumilaceae archaeon]|jgi:hypothetical protein|nr:hypothetical protein [Nitrosopumilaceae archaeon]
MICELCKAEENYDDREGGKITMVGKCGFCSVTVCHYCIDTHLETCIPFQMDLKETSILQ